MMIYDDDLDAQDINIRIAALNAAVNLRKAGEYPSSTIDRAEEFEKWLGRKR